MIECKCRCKDCKFIMTGKSYDDDGNEKTIAWCTVSHCKVALLQDACKWLETRK